MEQGGGSLLEVRPYILRASIGGRYFARLGDQPAVVGEIGRIQLENPAGSGVVLIVWTVTGVGLFAVGFTGRVGLAALATSVGAGFSMRPGVGTSVAAVRRGSVAAPVGDILFYFIVPINDTREYQTDGGLILDAGQRITVEGDTANNRIVVGFVWEEIAAL